MVCAVLGAVTCFMHLMIHLVTCRAVNRMIFRVTLWAICWMACWIKRVLLIVVIIVLVFAIVLPWIHNKSSLFLALCKLSIRYARAENNVGEHDKKTK